MGNCASLIFTTQGSWPPVAPETGGGNFTRDMDVFERASTSAEEAGGLTTMALEGQQEATR